MIDYKKTARGDIVKLVGEGAPGYAKLGDLLRVTRQTPDGVMVEDKNGEPMEFVYNCGAARLEKTPWRNDFPDQQAQDKCADCDLDKILAEIKKVGFKCSAGPLETHRGFMALVKKATALRVLVSDSKNVIEFGKARYELLREANTAPDVTESQLFEACNCLKKIIEGNSLL